MSFHTYIDRWGLVPTGAPLSTHTSDLLPVDYRGQPALLKIARTAEERRGAALLVWWQGRGAARPLQHDGAALLMERLEGPMSLAHLARTGQDDRASSIICTVAATLHTHATSPPPNLVPLAHWFRDLFSEAGPYGGIVARSARVARQLLNEPQDTVVLHGDLHHGNILDGGSRGWLAIDPKGLLGERGFDLANLFCNPDGTVATAPGRLARQATIVAQAAGLDRGRLLRWILAWAGLSAVWHGQDGSSPNLALAIAERAAQELNTDEPE